MELQTQLLLAREFDYIDVWTQEELTGIIEEVVKMLYTMTQK